MIIDEDNKAPIVVFFLSFLSLNVNEKLYENKSTYYNITIFKYIKIYLFLIV